MSGGTEYRRRLYCAGVDLLDQIPDTALPTTNPWALSVKDDSVADMPKATILTSLFVKGNL